MKFLTLLLCIFSSSIVLAQTSTNIPTDDQLVISAIKDYLNSHVENGFSVKSLDVEHQIQWPLGWAVNDYEVYLINGALINKKTSQIFNIYGASMIIFHSKYDVKTDDLIDRFAEVRRNPYGEFSQLTEVEQKKPNFSKVYCYYTQYNRKEINVYYKDTRDSAIKLETEAELERTPLYADGLTCYNSDGSTTEAVLPQDIPNVHYTSRGIPY